MTPEKRAFFTGYKAACYGPVKDDELEEAWEKVKEEFDLMPDEAHELKEATQDLIDMLWDDLLEHEGAICPENTIEVFVKDHPIIEKWLVLPDRDEE